jgi:hypothetical protein
VRSTRKDVQRSVLPPPDVLRVGIGSEGDDGHVGGLVTDPAVTDAVAIPGNTLNHGSAPGLCLDGVLEITVVPEAELRPQRLTGLSNHSPVSPSCPTL